MALPTISFLLFLVFLLHEPLFSSASIHILNRQKPKHISHHHPLVPSTNVTTYFEVTKPLKLPKTKPCSYHILQHDFGSTYGKPPVLANYTPPSCCPSRKFDKIVLEWKATCKGRQFDRIFGVWLGGVELFRSCTAEPRPTGIVWTVKKDITRYHSLLKTNQTFVVYLGNIVDATYTGIYHVNITLHFYPAKKHTNSPDLASGADLIIPISRSLPLNDGLWFEIKNSTDMQSKEINIPTNAYKAVLEVYISFHENDEFWYGNLPNEYIVTNNLTGFAGNGPFREVLVSLDGKIVGAVWPFTVVYTGGINYLFWRPISGIGSFDLPSYDIEITPLLGTLLDGKPHSIALSVTNALNVWFIDANLHIWLDKKSAKTEGKVLSHSVLPLRISSTFNSAGQNGTYSIKASRSIMSSGWVKSSQGKITTMTTQKLGYSNFQVMENGGIMQIVNQTIHMKDSIDTEPPCSSSSLSSLKSSKTFPLYIYYNTVDQGNGTQLSPMNLRMGFIEKRIEVSEFGVSVSNLKNMQKAKGFYLAQNNSITGGLGSTHQIYRFDGDESCYFRNISSTNYTIHYDKISTKCSSKRRLL